MSRLSYLFFDFGGCIDAPGIHTRILFWDAYRRLDLRPADAREEFQEAYTMADQRMMATGEAKAMGLQEFNRHNSRLIAEKIGVSETDAERAANHVTSDMREYIERSKKTLTRLGTRYPLGLISNFTGNLELILMEFGMRSLFDSVTESFYVGYSKPAPEIFLAALKKQAFPAAECLYVGDNPKNDIIPAKALGLRTALIHRPGEKQECGADYYVETLEGLVPFIQSK